MTRWASHMGLSLAAFTLMIGLGSVAVWLLAAGIALAGSILLGAVALYLVWISWRSRADRVWR